MAEKIVIAEVDINMDEAINDTIKLKETIAILEKQTAKAKEEQGELSAEYIQYSAALKGAQKDLKTQENLLIKVTQANNAQAGSLEQARLQLTIISAQWAKVTQIEGENSEKSKELAAEKLRLKTVITELEKATGTYTGQVGNYELATKSVRQEIKELTAAITKAKLAGDDNSDTVQAQKNRLGELKDAMADTAAEAKILGSDTKNLDIAVGTFTAIGSAAQVAEGSLALLGAEDENLQKSIQKMVAIQSVLNGVQEIGNALQKESALMIGLKSVAVKVATAAQWLWNAAMAANPIGLIIAGVAALAGGILLLSSRMGKSSDMAENLTLKLKGLEAQAKSTAELDEFAMKIMEARGAKDSEVTERLLTNNKKRQAALEEEIVTLEQLSRVEGLTDEQREALNKKYDEQNKLTDEAILLRIKLESQKAEATKKAAKEQVDAEKKLTEEAIKAAEIRYEMNKTTRDQALKDTELNYEKLINTEKLLYSQGAAIAKKQFDADLITREEYNQKIYNLQIERDDNIEALERKRSEKAVAEMNYELEVWRNNNKEKISGAEQLTKDLIAIEEKRLSEQQAKEKDILQKQLADKLITQNEYNLSILELEDQKNSVISELNKQFEEQERAKKIEAAQIDFDNQQALFEENALAQLDAQKVLNDKKRAEEIKTAEKVGADISLINKKYAKADEVLDRAKTQAKLSLAKDFASNIATIAGENTKVGKAAAAAAATINTYQAATGAYAALAPIPLVGPALGIAAAAAAVVSGLSQVKKIYATQPGSTPSSDSGTSASASSTAVTSSLQSVNTELGQGIVSRATETGAQNTQAQVIPTLVVDKVTSAQKIESAKVETATI